jgi:adenylosuccinate synthase
MCTAYRVDGKLYDMMPGNLDLLDRVEPVYEELPGWQTEVNECRDYNALPDNARRYIEKMSEIAETPVELVSVGPGREQTIEV